MRFEDFIQRFEKKAKTARGFMVRCPGHADGKASLSIGKARDGGVLLKCFAGCSSEIIVGAMGLELRDLFASEGKRDFKPYAKAPEPDKKRSASKEPEVKLEIEKIYSYTDALGRELYQAIRMKPKSFRQRHNSGGNWVWNMDGVERVLYRLQEVIKAQEVWIVEGEKDADNLSALGFCATCNVGGAGKWLDGYTEALKGKDIVICGDNDEPGRKHVELVFDSVSAKARSVKIIRLPGDSKDASDFIEANGDAAKAKLKEIAAGEVPHVGGVKLPLYTMAQLEEKYHRLVTQPDNLRLDLSRWLPSFRNRVRPLTPGSMVLIQGDTGTGKTNILQNIYRAFCDIPTVMFELEITEEDLFERFCAMHLNAEAREIEEEYKKYGIQGPETMNKMFPNLLICPESGVSVERVDQILSKADLYLGRKPKVVLLDYAQLMRGKGSSRYDRASDTAEGVRRLARAHGAAVFITSQIDRGSAREANNGLHSSKDSGSLENSSNVVIGADRDPEDQSRMTIRVLKSTKGGAGLEIECNFDGSRSRVTERQQEPNT